MRPKLNRSTTRWLFCLLGISLFLVGMKQLSSKDSPISVKDIEIKTVALTSLPNVICQNEEIITIGSKAERGTVYTSNLPKAAFYDNGDGTALISPMNVEEGGEFYVIAKKGESEKKQLFELIGVPESLAFTQTVNSKEGIAKFEISEIERSLNSQYDNWRFEGLYKNRLGANNQVEVSQYFDNISIKKLTTAYARITNVNGCNSIVVVDLNPNSSPEKSQHYEK